MFQKAQRKQAKLKIGISGPSGAGKTFSALRLASGIGKKIAVIDSERGSASLYSDRFDFDVLELTPPFTTEKYIEAMKAAFVAGYEVLIIDSVSHAWSGEGGILNQKEQLDARGGNSFANWAKMTPKQEKFISAIVQCPLHIICTMRSKQDYSQTQEGNKMKIQKVGLAPVQREGFEYELTTMFDVAMNHEAETSKDRTGLFVDKIAQITEDTGKRFIEWLGSAKQEVAPTPPPVQKEDDLDAALDKEMTEQESIGLFTNDEIAEANISASNSTQIKKPNLALATFKIKTGKYIGKTLKEINEQELYRYFAECVAYAKSGHQMPIEVVETLENIKNYLGLHD